MTITKIASNAGIEYLEQLLRNHGDDRYRLGLLRFFSAHPNSRFSKLAIVHAIEENGGRAKVCKVLVQLVDEGIVETRVENNTRLYLLTSNEPVHHMVLDLAELDWRQCQMMLTH